MNQNRDDENDKDDNEFLWQLFRVALLVVALILAAIVA